MKKLNPGLLKQVESENLKYYNEMTDKYFRSTLLLKPKKQ